MSPDDAHVAARNAEQLAIRRSVRAALEGAVIDRLVVHESDLGVFEEDWSVPRPFRYCASIVVVAGGTRTLFGGHESHGDLAVTVDDGPARGGGGQDGTEIEAVRGRRLVRLTYGVDAATGYVDGMAWRIEGAGTLHVFTGELDEDAAGHPILRRGDEMIFLFESPDDAERLGLAFEAADAGGGNDP